jgi:hypothetical protein
MPAVPAAAATTALVGDLSSLLPPGERIEGGCERTPVLTRLEGGIELLLDQFDGIALASAMRPPPSMSTAS